MTFSIVARCTRTGQFGAAVASSSPAVASRCIRARAGVGAVASQNVTDPALGNRALDLMEKGASAQQALDVLRSSSPHIEYRQLMLLGLKGPSAVFTGDKGLGLIGTAQGGDAACAGNLLANTQVVPSMLAAFEATEGDLCDRLLAAMQQGQEQGGEAGPIHSAGVLVVDAQSWPIIDLRIDWAEHDPLEGLRKLWTVYAPQAQSYALRALAPAQAPSYGVAGDR